MSKERLTLKSFKGVAKEAAIALLGILAVGLLPETSFAQAGADPVPRRSEGEGPYDRLILRGVNLIDGTGAPTRGPVDIVIENDRIVQIVNVGAPKLAIDPDDRPPLEGGQEIDLYGKYVLPGFIDTHMHLHHMGSGQNVPSEYILKLWLDFHRLKSSMRRHCRVRVSSVSTAT